MKTGRQNLGAGVIVGLFAFTIYQVVCIRRAEERMAGAASRIAGLEADIARFQVRTPPTQGDSGGPGMELINLPLIEPDGIYGPIDSPGSGYREQRNRMHPVEKAIWR